MSRSSLDLSPWVGAALAIAMAFAVLGLETWHLRTAVLTYTDEGVFAETGRRLMAGEHPHVDYQFAHTLTLPFLIGLGLRTFGSMYPLRVAYTAATCLAVIPLYGAFVAIGRGHPGRRMASLTAVFFYLTYHQLTRYDGRFLAVRPLADVAQIVFLYVGVTVRARRWRCAGQTLMAVVASLLYAPALINIAALGVALAFWQRDENDNDRHGARDYAAVVFGAAASLLAYFTCVQGSFTPIVLGQWARPSDGRLTRIADLYMSWRSLLLYVAGTAGLIHASMSGVRVRGLARAMLVTVVASLFLTPNFLLHYLTIAAPAFALGIAGAVLALYEAASTSAKPMRIVAAGLVLLVGAQAAFALPDLLGEWIHNDHPEYRDFIDALARTPEPLLTVTPIDAVEARRRMSTDLDAIAMRPPRAVRLPDDAFERAGDRACTILLDDDATEKISAAVRNRWMRTSTTASTNRWGAILVSSRPECR